MYKCVCGAVTESEIKFYIDIMSPTVDEKLTVDDIMNDLNVGIGCESCLDGVNDIIDSHYDEMDSFNDEGIVTF